MSVRDLANCIDSAITQIILLGVEAKKENLSTTIPKKLLDLHQTCRFHIHDMEFYDSAYNCIGLKPSELIKEKPLSFSAACRELFRGIIALTNQQSGGIGLIDFDEDMSQFIRQETNEELENELYELFMDLNTYVRKGSERAYVTFNFGLSTSTKGRQIIKSILNAFSKKQFIFPNLVWKVKTGINRYKSDPNYDLFLLSCDVTSKCMNPTYFNTDASFNKNINASEIGIMGCRTRVVANHFGTSSSLNRGNIAAITINLVQIAFEAKGNQDTFNNLLRETTDNAAELLLHRFKMLIKNGDFQHLKENNLYIGSELNDSEKMLKNGTLSIGFIGLWDSLAIIYGVEEWTIEKLDFYYPKALEIIQSMRYHIDDYAKKTNLNFSLLASSAEGVSGRFPKYDEKCYNSNSHIFDKGHYTNSFHIPVQTNLSCFKKLDLEGPFHKLCNGGHISYIELSEIPFGNKEAILDLVNYACDSDVGYFGVNFPLDICKDCGKKGNFEENCICGSSNILRLRRVSGYLSDVNTFTVGKFNELQLRSAHVSKI